MTAVRPRRPASPALAAVVGPTASGKTEFSLALAGLQPVEILVADSRQVYRWMDIGTAKPDAQARARVPHHLVDLVEPSEPFTVAQWVHLARPLVGEVAARGRLPLLVGGTGLYVTALVDGLDFAAQPFAPEIRAELTAELETGGLEPLSARLTALQPDIAARTDLRNPRRVLRALERAMAGGTVDTLRATPFAGRLALLGLTRPLAELDRRISVRARAMFGNGLLTEAAALLECGLSPDRPALSGHGYAEAIRVVTGEWSIDQAVEVAVRRTRQYARRQLRWFRRDSRIVWLDLADKPADDPQLLRRGSDLLSRLLNR